VISYFEFVVSQVSKSRPGAPAVGTRTSGQRPRAFSGFNRSLVRNLPWINALVLTATIEEEMPYLLNSRPMPTMLFLWDEQGCRILP
jgi:hypothetical protein